MRALLLAACLAVWWSPGWAAGFDAAVGVDNAQDHPEALRVAGITEVTVPTDREAASLALVIGINDYPRAGALHGAVADAEHLAAAMRTAGASDVLVLTDANASRAAIAAAWQDLVWRTQPGDTIVFSFAGRGAREPSRGSGSAGDTLLLSGFTEAGPGNGERITRNQLFDWFAEAKGLNVLFIGDTSYSGAPTRPTDPRAPAMAQRATVIAAITDDALPPPGASPRTILDLPYVAMLMAGDDGEVIAEVMIDGVARGALSWTAARAIEGRADHNGDARLTLDEITAYVVENVRVLSERRHHPRMLTMAPSSSVVLAYPADFVLPLTDKTPWVGVHVLGVENEDAQTLRYTIGPSVVLSASVPHELIWDADRLEMISTGGDVVATLPENDIRHIRRVIDKWNLVAAVRDLGERSGLRLRLDHGDGLYRAGSRMKLNIGIGEQPFLTLFSIAADGTTDFLYPLFTTNLGGSENLLKVRVDTAFELALETGPPFGADHLIAVTSASALSDLHETLRIIDGKPAPKLLRKMLVKVLDGIDYRISIQALYTAP